MGKHQQLHFHKYQFSSPIQGDWDGRYRFVHEYLQKQSEQPGFQALLDAVPTTMLPCVYLNPPKIPFAFQPCLRTGLGKMRPIVMAMESQLEKNQRVLLVRDIRRDMYWPVVVNVEDPPTSPTEEPLTEAPSE